MARTDRWTIRFDAEQAEAIEAAAEREGVTPSELIRDGAVRRARSSGGGVLLPVGPELARRLEAVARIEGVAPERWAIRALDVVAGRRLAGTGLGATVTGGIATTKEARRE